MKQHSEKKESTKKSTAARMISTGAGKTAQRPRTKSVSPVHTPAEAGAVADPQSDAIELLKREHDVIEQHFARYERLASREEKETAARQTCFALVAHACLEEELLYPACRAAGMEATLIDKAQVELDLLKVLIRDLLWETPDSDFHDAKLAVLREQVKHHVHEEQRSGTGILAKASAAGVDMSELGLRIQTRQQELASDEEPWSVPQPVSLQLFFDEEPQEEHTMASQYGRDRDEQGRFSSDNHGGSRSNRSRYDEDDDRGYRSRGSDDRERDQYGRFVSDDRGGSSRSGRPRYEENDDRGYRSRGSDDRERDQYGRFVNDERGGSSRSGRSRYDEEDDRGYRSRGSDDRERDQYGRFVSDDRGGSSRSGRSRYDEEDDRGYRSRGSDDRERDQYGRFVSDDRGGSSRSGRSRYDEEDDRGYRSHGSDDRERDQYGRFVSDDRSGSSRSGRSRDDDDRGGHGRGWFGDPRGHAEAAREGWRHR